MKRITAEWLAANAARITEKVNAGLSREQAIEVIQDQDRHDGGPGGIRLLSEDETASGDTQPAAPSDTPPSAT